MQCLKVFKTRRFNKAKCSLCTWVGATSGINTGWGLKGLRAALRRRTWGYW